MKQVRNFCCFWKTTGQEGSFNRKRKLRSANMGRKKETPFDKTFLPAEQAVYFVLIAVAGFLAISMNWNRNSDFSHTYGFKWNWNGYSDFGEQELVQEFEFEAINVLELEWIEVFPIPQPCSGRKCQGFLFYCHLVTWGSKTYRSISSAQTAICFKQPVNRPNLHICAIYLYLNSAYSDFKRSTQIRFLPTQCGFYH